MAELDRDIRRKSDCQIEKALKDWWWRILKDQFCLLLTKRSLSSISYPSQRLFGRWTSRIEIG